MASFDLPWRSSHERGACFNASHRWLTIALTQFPALGETWLTHAE
jgi:hypothetical protein